MADSEQFIPPATGVIAAAEGASASDPRTGIAPPRRSWRRYFLFLIAPTLLLLSLFGGYWGWDAYRARKAWREADAAARSRDFPTAAARIERYTALRPDDPAGWFLAARTARRDGRFEDASRFLAKSEKLGMAAQS
ncbi:MAG TPA: hypothetical protein VLM40_20875, partial [Gemmata sp.]|nr:hypothetical protein [Gemmata sp.]